MTTTKTFNCNLCRDKITELSGVGVKFLGSSKVEQVPVPLAENHLCKSCVEGVKKFVTADRMQIVGVM